MGHGLRLESNDDDDNDDDDALAEAMRLPPATSLR